MAPLRPNNVCSAVGVAVRFLRSTDRAPIPGTGPLVLATAHEIPYVKSYQCWAALIK